MTVPDGMGLVNLEERRKWPWSTQEIPRKLDVDLIFQKEERRKHRKDRIHHSLQFGAELSLNSVPLKADFILGKSSAPVTFRVSCNPPRTFIASNEETNP